MSEELVREMYVLLSILDHESLSGDVVSDTIKELAKKRIKEILEMVTKLDVEEGVKN